MSHFEFSRIRAMDVALVATILVICSISAVEAGGGLSFEHIAATRSVGEIAIAPNGSFVAYTLNVPRIPGVDDDGPAWRELHVVAVENGVANTYVGGEVSVSAIRFSPDGELITYLAKRDGDENTSLWAIPLSGGESRRLVGFETDISDYCVSPDGGTVAFIARQPKFKVQSDLESKGYTQEVFEEDWLPKKVWVVPFPSFEAPAAIPTAAVDEDENGPIGLEIEGSVSQLRFSPDGRSLAVAIAPRPLVDDEMMFKKVTIVDAENGSVRTTFDNPGKLGAFEFSPDGTTIAMISAEDPNDPSAGCLMVAPSTGGELQNLVPDHEGHIYSFAWRDNDTLMFIADEGEETLLAEISVRGGESKTIATSGEVKNGVRIPIMSRPSLSREGGRTALIGESPDHPGEVYTVVHGEGTPRRLTDSNPWLADVDLAPQEVFRHQARDGLELSGVLIRPMGSQVAPAPLIVFVHGGPEGHRRNGWLSSYSAPGQLAAARGYAVFYPNYRGSTGRGVAFSKLGQHDAAGKEFDDVVDAVDALAAAGIADKDRVGVSGGSYGGYATAWLSTTYSERFRAGVMFVGISNKVSKGMTTEIPVEDIMVHSRYRPYTNWQFSLERSPIYHVEKCRTPLLIAGGTADSRVHPSQSLQFYRGLKLIGKTPVRYVRYPGEPHGNRRAASRDDYSRRLMRWMDHFVVNGETELPPWRVEYADGVAKNVDE